jgi:hypothetical protein
MSEHAEPEQTQAEFIAELRAENSRRYAEEGSGHSCLFDDVLDEQIPEGCDCGGCSCHLLAPCRHCLRHLEPEESWHIDAMLDLTGRATR